MISVAELTRTLSEYGLLLRGCFQPNAADGLPEPVAKHSTLFLVGNGGSSLWDVFSQSQEFHDGFDHPLDRWSQRVGKSIAVRYSGEVYFPFEGPPYLPFLRWTEKAEGLEQSPLGLRLDPNFGLWHAYRFALYLPFNKSIKKQQTESDLSCSSCSSKPCLRGCPVNAFSVNGYDVSRCVNYLRKHPEAACHTLGCLARHACPVGKQHAYVPAHAQFHMRAFIEAHRSAGKAD